MYKICLVLLKFEISITSGSSESIVIKTKNSIILMCNVYIIYKLIIILLFMF